MACTNTDRLFSKMKAANLDGLVVCKPENFYYVTGYQNYFAGVATGVVRQAVAMAVVAADRSVKPAAIISSWEEVTARASSGWEDIRTFILWVEIADVRDLKANQARRVEKPVQYDMENNIRILADILREKGLAEGRLGLELNCISYQAFSYLAKQLPRAHFVDSEGLLFDVQAVKTPPEIEILRQATRMTQETTLAVSREKLSGATVGEIRLMYHQAALREVAANPNVGFQEAKLTISIGGDFTPKTGAPSYRAARGDIIFMDVGIILKGYQSDLGRSLVVGRPDDFQKRIHSALKNGLEEALAAIRPGAKCSEIFQIGQETIRRGGFDSYTRGHLGHAVGVGKHERPPFLAPGDETVLEPGMMFSVETPFYIHGAGGFQIEDTILVTDGGYELLSDWPRDLIEVQ